jgi:hypothetical protein
MSEMQHRSQCEQPSRDSRRQFLGTLSSAAAAAWIGLGRSAPAETPAAMPTITLGKHRVSRLLAGSNPILGYSYQGPHCNQHMKEYFTVERTVEVLKRCEAAGITAHQFSSPDRAAPYIRALRDQGSKLQYICLHSQREKIQEAVDAAQPIAMVHHGGATDKLFATGKSERVHDYVKAVHDAGMLAGVSAHNPDNIKRVADEGWEVDLFMGCFYFLTRFSLDPQVTSPTLDFPYPFMKDDPLAMTAVIKQVKQPCLGFKILGAGRKCATQDTVKAAFRFAFENIKPIDGVIVGMFPWSFDEVSADAQYVRQLGRLPG